MARREFNAGFVAIGLAATAGVVGGGYYLQKYLRHRPEKPEVYIAAAKADEKRGDLASAAQNWGFAASLLPNDAVAHFEHGRLLSRVPTLGNANMEEAEAEWKRAEEIKPDYKEAWSRLFTAELRWLDVLEYQGAQLRDNQRQGVVGRIGTAPVYARQLMKLGPKDADAISALPVLYIRMYLLGLTLPPAEQAAGGVKAGDRPLTDEQRVARAATELSQVAHDHPGYADASFWPARLKVFQAKQAKSLDPTYDVHPACAEAIGLFDDAITAAPKVIDLYVDKVRVIMEAGKLDTAQPVQLDMIRQARDASETAASLVDPAADAEQYGRIRLNWALVLAQTDPGRAETILNDLIARYPAEAGYRYELARMLSRDPSRRADALAKLDAIASQPPAGSTELQRVVYQQVLPKARLLRVKIETEQYQNTTNPRQREQLGADIEAALAEAAKYLRPDDQELLTVRGRYQLVSGRVADAIATLASAVDVMNRDKSRYDADLLYYMVQAYKAGGQNGKALEIIEGAIRDPLFSNSAEVHLTQAEMYLQDHRFADARKPLDWLALRMPDNPRVIAMQIMDLGASAKMDQARPLYDRLPEKTLPELQVKLVTAVRLGEQDETIRLLRAMLRAKPNDPDIAVGLAQKLDQAGQRDEAAGVVNDAVKANPGNSALALEQKVLAGATTPQLAAERLKQIELMPDMLEREAALAAYYRAVGQPLDEVKHLKAALELKPKTKEWMIRLFQLDVQTGQPEAAADLIPQLSAINADALNGGSFKLMLALSKGDGRTAVDIGRQLTTDFPQVGQPYLLYGQALQVAGQTDLAIAEYAIALDRMPGNTDALGGMIACNEQAGRVEDARRYLRDAIARYPDNAGFREMQIQFETAHGDPDAVMPLVEAAVKQSPGDRRLAIVADDAYAGSGAKLAAAGDDAGAKARWRAEQAFLRGIVDKSPDDLEFAQRLALACAKLDDLPQADAVLSAVADRPLWKKRPEPKVQLGRLYMAAGRPVQAESPLRDAVALAPDLANARMLLADDLVAMKQPDRALEALRPACGNFDVRARYTELQLKSGQVAAADAELTEAMKAHPGDPAYAELLAVVLEAEKKHAEAIASVDRVLAANPNDVKARVIRGRLLMASVPPDTAGAAAEFRRVVDAAPNSPEGRGDLADVLAATGDREGMTTQLAALVKMLPDNVELRLRLAGVYATAVPSRLSDAERVVADGLARPGAQHQPNLQVEAAVLYARDGQPDKSLAAVRDAMDEAAKQDKAAKTTATADAMLASYVQVLFMNQRYDQVVTESAKLAANPKAEWSLFSLRGQARAKAGDPAGADREFAVAADKVAALPPAVVSTAGSALVAAVASVLGDDKAVALAAPRAKASDPWKVVLGDAYTRAHRYADVLATVAPLAADPPPAGLSPTDRYQAIKMIGLAYSESTPPQPDRAVETYKKLLAMNPDDVDALNNLASVLTDVYQPPRGADAVVYSQKAVDLCTRIGRVPPRVNDTHGWALIASGKVDAGMALLNDVVDKADFPDVHYHMAMGYLRQGHPDDARRELKRASDLMDAQAKAPAVPGVQVEAPDPTMGSRIEAARKQVDVMAAQPPKA